MIREPNKKTDGKILWNVIVFILFITGILDISLNIIVLALILKILIEIKYVILDIFLEEKE